RGQGETVRFPEEEAGGGTAQLVVVCAEGLAELLGERLGGHGRTAAPAAELLDRDVARGVDVSPRNDPRRPVLVPDPDVLHREVEEGIARLRIAFQVELVAEIR